MGKITPFLDDIALGVLLVVAALLLAPDLLLWVALGLLLWFGLKAFLLRSHLAPPAIGVEAMVDRVGTATSDLAPRGHVTLDGELWQAEAHETVRAGERVRVIAVEGLLLRVAPVGVAGGTLSHPPGGSMLLAIARRLRAR